MLSKSTVCTVKQQPQRGADAAGVRVYPVGVAGARELSIHWHLPASIKDMTPRQLRALTSGTVGADMIVNFDGAVTL